MLIPVLSWGSPFLALLLPETGTEDVPGELPRIAGLPVNLFVAAFFVLLSVAAWWLSVSAQDGEKSATRQRSAAGGLDMRLLRTFGRVATGADGDPLIWNAETGQSAGATRGRA
jgi:hypothetical protein